MRGVDRASSLVVIALVCRGYVLPANLGYYWIMVIVMILVLVNGVEGGDVGIRLRCLYEGALYDL